MYTIGSKTLPLFTLAAALVIAGCHSNQTQPQTTDTSTTAQDQSAGPDTSNLAPVAEAPVSNAEYTTTPQQGDDSGDYSPDESQYGIQPDEYAQDPPPPLPEYDQPPCPGDGYIWTPGYWDYASTGYYWVPGAWVQAPYQDALWTPGYWAYSNGRYAFFHGYWGPHIGFYGDVNYGFGYAGVGYQGGYWNGNNFYYNRSVNNVNVTVVHNVYSRNITNYTTTRVSYNGGNGGIQARPRPAELAALREPHAQPMAAQIQMQHQASANRADFATVNHGKPAQVAYTRPVQADHDVRPVASPTIRNLPPAARPVPAARPEARNGAANRPAANEPSRPTPNQQPMNRPQTNGQDTNNRPAPYQAPARTEPGRTEPNRPAPQPERSTPQVMRPAPTPARPVESRPAPRPAPEQHAAPAPRPAPEQHNAPAPEKKGEHPDR